MAAIHPKISRAEWSQLLKIENPWRRGWFTDDEAAADSGVSARTLRTGQALGLICSIKAQRPKGAQIRMWSAEDVLLASLLGEVVSSAGLAIPMAVRLLTFLPAWILEELIGQFLGLVFEAFETLDPEILGRDTPRPDSRQPDSYVGDISLAVVDRRYIFVEGRFPELLEDAEPGLGLKLVGIVGNVYDRHTAMKRITKDPSNTVRARLKEVRDHAVSVHAINLDLALRRRALDALKRKVKEQQNRR